MDYAIGAGFLVVGIVLVIYNIEPALDCLYKWLDKNKYESKN